MCFSAEASFGASVVLAVMGYTTIKMNRTKAQLFLAAIPLLFAIQQLTEGFVWFFLNNPSTSITFSKIAQNIFLIFAFLVWPIWIPLSLALVEKVDWRRKLIYADLACGVGLSAANLLAALTSPASVKIINYSLQYVGHAPYQTYLYPLIVLLPCFLSSYKNMWVFGSLVAVAFLISQYFYEATFVSVWCFFSALVSMILYKIIKDNSIESTDSKTQTLN
jgi:hypothetical protein